MMGHIHGFQPGRPGRAWDGLRAPPEPDRGDGGPALPEREWGLTAGQVVAAVLAILAACELIGLLS